MITLKIILVVLIVAFWFALGYLVAIDKASKDLDDIENDVDRAIEAYERVVEASDGVIDSCESYIRTVHDYLALCRDEGFDDDDIDTLIDSMEGFLNHFEERRAVLENENSQ